MHAQGHYCYTRGRIEGGEKQLPWMRETCCSSKACQDSRCSDRITFRAIPLKLSISLEPDVDQQHEYRGLPSSHTRVRGHTDALAGV